MAEYKTPYDGMKYPAVPEPKFTREEVRILEAQAYREGYRDGYRDGHKDA